jgi:threonine/homoserine/homoserine lactone efflux protein
VSLLVVAAVFGAINLPSVGSWTLLGMQLRRFLNDPVRLRVFNVTMAVILVATLYPIVFAAPH